MEINLDEYTLVKPDYIVKKHITDNEKFYDIEVEGEHSFFIYSEDKEISILSHNCDGHHIMSLLINLFFKWFPWIINSKMLYFLETPLISVGERNKTYYYSIDEFKKDTIGKRLGKIRYLKGLGSLSLDDWDFVMKNKRMINIIRDRKSANMLEMAFGKSTDARKVWLSSFNV